jgi:hypothetical protein
MGVPCEADPIHAMVTVDSGIELPRRVVVICWVDKALILPLYEKSRRMGVCGNSPF